MHDYILQGICIAVLGGGFVACSRTEPVAPVVPLMTDYRAAPEEDEPLVHELRTGDGDETQLILNNRAGW